ncbi:MAG: tRNA pseudouridine(55) synthase, partial [Bacteroidota bacterium]|nr:tRNA pseudouridine(55) synthase [Bacteroidota bacterium]
ARKGDRPVMEERTVNIYDFSIEQVQLPMVYFRVYCSKGTYIRSLAHDLGQKLGVGGYLFNLCRTRIGDYKLEDAWQLDKLVEMLQQRKEAEKAP